MDIREFDRRLREIAPRNARPFLCEGSPLRCELFLAGLNPRTRTPFWPFWSVPYGCSKKRWLDAYLQREGQLGRTREHIEILLRALAPIRCLETNIFCVWSDRMSELAEEHRSTIVFDFLLTSIKPRVIFVHGRRAISHMERITGSALPLNQFRTVQVGNRETSVFPTHHLSYQLSRAGCRRLAERIRRYVLSK